MKFRDYLQENKRSAKVWAESVTAQIVRIAKDKLQLTVEQSPIVQWVQKQLERNKKEECIEKQEATNHQKYHL